MIAQFPCVRSTCAQHTQGPWQALLAVEVWKPVLPAIGIPRISTTRRVIGHHRRATTTGVPTSGSTSTKAENEEYRPNWEEEGHCAQKCQPQILEVLSPVKVFPVLGMCGSEPMLGLPLL